jgi:hypothetical protein
VIQVSDPPQHTIGWPFFGQIGGNCKPPGLDIVWVGQFPDRAAMVEQPERVCSQICYGGLSQRLGGHKPFPPAGVGSAADGELGTHVAALAVVVFESKPHTDCAAGPGLSDHSINGDPARCLKTRH